MPLMPSSLGLYSPRSRIKPAVIGVPGRPITGTQPCANSFRVSPPPKSGSGGGVMGTGAQGCNRESARGDGDWEPGGRPGTEGLGLRGERNFACLNCSMPISWSARLHRAVDLGLQAFGPRVAAVNALLDRLGLSDISRERCFRALFTDLPFTIQAVTAVNAFADRGRFRSCPVVFN